MAVTPEGLKGAAALKEYWVHGKGAALYAGARVGILTGASSIYGSMFGIQKVCATPTIRLHLVNHPERGTDMADKKQKQESKEGSLEATVFVPRGQVREGDIKRAALLAARDNIPVAAFDVKLEITNASDVKTVDGREGRDYTVKISFTPRKTTDPDDAHEAVTVDKVLASLEPLTPEKLAEATAASEK